jgi:hypothetical protein
MLTGRKKIAELEIKVEMLERNFAKMLTAMSDLKEQKEQPQEPKEQEYSKFINRDGLYSYKHYKNIRGTEEEEE